MNKKFLACAALTTVLSGANVATAIAVSNTDTASTKQASVIGAICIEHNGCQLLVSAQPGTFHSWCNPTPTLVPRMKAPCAHPVSVTFAGRIFTGTIVNAGGYYDGYTGVIELPGAPNEERKFYGHHVIVTSKE